MGRVHGRLALVYALGAAACGADEGSYPGAAPATRQGADAQVTAADNTQAGGEQTQPPEHPLRPHAAHDASNVEHELDPESAFDAGQFTEELDAGAEAGVLDAAFTDSAAPVLQEGGLDASVRDGAIDSAVSDAESAADAQLPDATLDAESSVDAPYASFSRVYAILDQSCNNSCHRPGAAYSLDLSTRQLSYLELIGGEGKGAMEFITCANMGLFRVVPGNAAQSVLIQKLESTQSCGDRMPPGGALSASAIAEIRAWIIRGALND